MTTKENSLQALRDRVLKRVELQPEAFHPAGNPNHSDDSPKDSNADLLRRIELLEKEVAEGRKNLTHVAELVGRLADLVSGTRDWGYRGQAGASGSAGGAGAGGGDNLYITNDYERRGFCSDKRTYNSFGRLTGMPSL